MTTKFGKMTGKWMVMVDATGAAARLPNGRVALFASQAAALRWIAEMIS